MKKKKITFNVRISEADSRLIKKATKSADITQAQFAREAFQEKASSILTKEKMVAVAEAN